MHKSHGALTVHFIVFNRSMATLWYSPFVRYQRGQFTTGKYTYRHYTGSTPYECTLE